MNESLDLRKRISKMRESNNSLLNEKKSIKQDLDFNIKDKNKDKLDFSTLKTLDNHVSDKSSKITEYSTPQNEIDIINTKKNSQVISTNTNEAQFRILANKFNEAVEVILELSEKVKKLENLLDNSNLKEQSKANNYKLLNFKFIALIIMIIILSVSIFRLPIDLQTIKIIIFDIFSSI